MALIDSKQTEFEGRQVQVFHELILHRAIVAIGIFPLSFKMGLSFLRFLSIIFFVHC